MPRTLKLSVFVSALGLLFVHTGAEMHAQAPGLSWDGLIEHVTEVPYSSDPSPDGSSALLRHGVSADGRFVLFTSAAQNLNPSQAVLLRDRDTGDLQTLFGTYQRGDFSMSADGNSIAYRECNQYMRPDQASICDVWIYDKQWNGIRPMSTTSDGTFGDADSGMPVLSGNGRFVVFRTNATNLLPAGAAPGQLVIRDRDADGNGIYDEPGTSTIELVSAADGGFVPADNTSDVAEVSDDGRYVAFRSMASNLIGVPGGTYNGPHVFLRDRLTHGTRMLDRQVTGYPSPFPVDRAEISMSGDGRYVAFVSADHLLTGGSTSDLVDVYVYDRDTQLVTRIDLNTGLPDGNEIDAPMLTADGRYVAMKAWSPNNTVGGYTKGVFVYDRTAGTSTKVSVLPDGSDLNGPTASPTISADGTVVLFTSTASNIQPGIYTQFDRIYAAVHFDVQPAEVHVPGRGGIGTFNVTTQQHTRWSANWDWNQYWGAPNSPWWNNHGSGSVDFIAQQRNFDPTPRSALITIGSRTVTFTQDAGLSLTSLTPNVGALAGGTQVTLHGTGFEPGMHLASNGGGGAPVQFIDSTTAIATMPYGAQPGWSYVSIFTTDFYGAFLDNAFRYLDATPPFVWADVEPQNQNEWYTTDVTVTWYTWDQETQVTSTVGCGPTVINTDTPGTTLTCSATSEGGTTSSSVTIKRDATPPVLTATQPAAQTLYTANSVVPADYHCTDALSGTSWCHGDVNPGEPIDTSETGFDRTFTLAAVDQAGNFNWTQILYDVSSWQCWAPPSPTRAWWRMEGDTRDLSGGLVATPTGMSPGSFVQGLAGQGFLFPSRASGFLQVAPSARLDVSSAATLAMWINPADATAGVLLSHPSQYVVKRLGDGSIQWTFYEADGGSISATIPNAAPAGKWTHIALRFDNGTVESFVNGRLVRTDSRPGVVQPSGGSGATIGGVDDAESPAPFIGTIDELQLFDTAFDGPAWVQQIYLAGSHGVCVPAATTLTVNVPSSIDYGTSSYLASAQLLDAGQQPIAGKSITLSSGAASTTLVTDGSGSVSWTAPASFPAAGTYSNAFTAVFEGDLDYQRADIARDIVVRKITPHITWTAPSDIAFGTALGGAQLNATADVPGTFSYSPAAGSVPGAGTQTLSVTFHPSDATDYDDASASVALTVQKAQPSMTIAGGTFTYDGGTHAASASATDYLGQPLLPLTITYNGSSALPVNAGSYSVVASFAGNANYLPCSVSATIDIQRAPLTVTAANTTKVFGAPLPSFGAGASGFVNGETWASLSGALSFSTTATAGSPVGAYAVTPGGLTSSNYAITFVNGTLTVTSASSQVAAGANANPSGLNQGVTFSATVTIVSPGAGTPAGTIEFRDGSTRLGTVAVSNGAASLTTNGLSAGAHSISAIYSGNANIMGSSQSFTQTVRTSAQSSMTALASSANPAIEGANVTLTATVTAPAGLSGNVAFYDGTALIGAAALSGTKAKLVTSMLALGAHAITARYLGNATIPPSISPVFSQTIKASSGTLRNASASIIASPAPSALDQTVTFTVTVSGNQQTPPTGAVLIFVDGLVVAGPITLSPSGNVTSAATFTTNALAHGVHDVTVAYLGDGTYKGDTGTMTLTVN